MTSERSERVPMTRDELEEIKAWLDGVRNKDAELPGECLIGDGRRALGYCSTLLRIIEEKKKFIELGAEAVDLYEEQLDRADELQQRIERAAAWIYERSPHEKATVNFQELDDILTGKEKA